jgi:hypothetical protein
MVPSGVERVWREPHLFGLAAYDAASLALRPIRDKRSETLLNHRPSPTPFVLHALRGLSRLSYHQSRNNQIGVLVLGSLDGVPYPNAGFSTVGYHHRYDSRELKNFLHSIHIFDKSSK